MKIDLRYEARDYFVNHNFGIETILKIFGEKKVSRKTLYNWRKSDDWDGQRRAIQKENELISSDLVELARTAIAEAKANPIAKNIFAVAKMVAVLRTIKTVNIDKINQPDIEEKVTKKTFSQEALDEVEKELLGL